MHCLPRRLEEKHQQAAKVLDNNESAFWEETVDQEKAKRMAGQALGHLIISICPAAQRFLVHCAVFIIHYRSQEAHMEPFRDRIFLW